jgi:hypothetical protein
MRLHRPAVSVSTAPADARRPTARRPGHHDRGDRRGVGGQRDRHGPDVRPGRGRRLPDRVSGAARRGPPRSPPSAGRRTPSAPGDGRAVRARRRWRAASPRWSRPPGAPGAARARRRARSSGRRCRPLASGRAGPPGRPGRRRPRGGAPLAAAGPVITTALPRPGSFAPLGRRTAGHARCCGCPGSSPRRGAGGLHGRHDRRDPCARADNATDAGPGKDREGQEARRSTGIA